ncbi:MAG: hypothetical protein ABSA18_15295, partial [Dehalococcoidia bacterium]
MRRLLISLPIALSIFMALIFPMAAYASGLLLNDHITSVDASIISSGFMSSLSLAQDNATGLPDGLTLTKGVPFIAPSEVTKGNLVTVKVKATNNSTQPINYALTLTINGKAAGSPQQLSLDPAGSKDVAFQVAADTTGNNDVTVGSLKGFFTVNSGSFFDSLPIYLWIFFGVIAVVIIMLVVLMVMKPPKKRAGALPDQGKKQGKQAGKAGKPGAREPQMQPGGGMQRPSMANAPDGMLFGNQGPQGQSQDMSGMQQQYPQPGMQQQQFQPQPGMQQPFQQQPGMQQPFQPPQQPGMQQFSQQPGMQQPFQPQPGMQQPFQSPQQPGMQPPQQPGMRAPQYPQNPQMPQPPQPHGMQPG